MNDFENLELIYKNSSCEYNSSSCENFKILENKVFLSCEWINSLKENQILRVC